MSNQPLMVVFDAPVDLKRAFFDNGFKPFGKQAGAWCKPIERGSADALDLEYELSGVGLAVRWWGASGEVPHS